MSRKMFIHWVLTYHPELLELFSAERFGPVDNYDVAWLFGRTEGLGWYEALKSEG